MSVYVCIYIPALKPYRIIPIDSQYRMTLLLLRPLAFIKKAGSAFGVSD